MNSKQRGTPGYCKYAKRIELIKTVVMFTLVLVILFMGILTTGSRMNLLTIAAVIGCLPAARYCVNFIARAPYPSLEPSFVSEIKETAGEVPVIYELILGAKDHIRFVDCVAVSHHCICGYVGYKKTDPADAEAYIRKVCAEKGIRVSVKLYTDFGEFLTRLQELQVHYSNENRKAEQNVLRALIDVCL